MTKMDGLLDGLICDNCEGCDLTVKHRYAFGGRLESTMCDECFEMYEDMERERKAAWRQATERAR